MTVNFTRFGKLVSPTIVFGAKNIHPNDSCLYNFGKLGSVTTIPIPHSPKKLGSVTGFLGNEIKNEKTE
jgi:hypothetical protein